MCIAHFVRVLRWQLFIEIYEKPQRGNLIQGLVIGNVLNNFLPYKLGEFARAWFSGRKMKNGFALSLSTVIVDRYLDIICVGIIFAGLSVNNAGGTVAFESAAFYIISALTLILLLILIYALRGYVKKLIVVIAGIFNSEIEANILRVSWALIWNFKDIFQKINKKKLLLTTVGMWAGYIVSYFVFAKFITALGNTATWIDIFIMLFTQNGIKASTSATVIQNVSLSGHPAYMSIYLLLPLVILLAISFFIKPNLDAEKDDNYLNLLPHLDPDERLRFLENYFSDSNKDYIKNYLKINQDISIIRDYSAGSNATTMLCMDGQRTFFRKYAFGEDGEKLYQQIQWIEANRERLVLPQILKQEKTDIYCYYDMPYNSNSVGLFEYAHSMPLDDAWQMIRRALESLENSIYQVNVRKADADTINKYIQSKVLKNIEKIKSAKYIKKLLPYKTVVINGIEYRNLSFYEKYLSEEYLSKIFENDTYATIHGDLTIENIICTRDSKGKDDFYIIDPNTGNVHDSPNLDYGKLLQSIHGGYEFLMSTKEITVSENRMNFLFTKSAAYVELHERLRDYMKSELGEERTRSIYFHEIIHWLRLMPYKIEKNGKRSLLFYAGMLMVMNDVFEMYGDEETGFGK